MSMDDTEKWASQIIHELFDGPLDRNVIDVPLIDNDESNENGNYERLLLEDDLIANEYETCTDLGSSYADFNEFIEIFDDSIMTPGKPSNINDGTSKSLPAECNVFELLPNNREIEDVKDTLNYMLSYIENSTEEKKVDSSILETVNGQFISTETIISNPFKDKFFEKSSDITKTYSTLDLKAFYKDDLVILKNIDGKVKTLEFRGYSRENNLNNINNRLSHSLTDVCVEYFGRNFNKEKMRWCRSDSPLSYRIENTKMVKTDLFNALKKFDVKQRGSSSDGDYKTQTNSIVTKVNTEDGDPFNQWRMEGIKEIKCSKKVPMKFKKPVKKFHCSVDDIYQNFRKKGVQRNRVKEIEIIKSSTPIMIRKSGSIQPILNSIIEDINYENMSMECFDESDNGTSSSEDAHRERKNQFRRDDENDKNDHSDDEVILERTVKIITFYRNMCSHLETILVRPCAILIAESIDFLLFVILMAAYLIYLFFEKTSVTISYFFQNILLPSLNRMSGRENDHGLTSFDEFPSLLTDFREKSVETRESVKCNEYRLVSKKDINVSNEFNIANMHLNVNPKDVLIIDAMFEQINQKFDYKYEKGEYFKFLGRKHMAVVKLYDASFIDILLEACEESTADKTDGNNYDMEIIASSIRSGFGFKLHELEDFGQYNKRKWFQHLQKISAAISTDLKILTLANFNDSDLKMSPNNDERYKLNSTELDDSQFLMRDNSRKRFHCSDDDILQGSEYCFSPTTIDTSCCSMSVNLPSFDSRSNMYLNANSLSLSNKMADVSENEESIASAANGKLELKMSHEDFENRKMSDDPKNPDPINVNTTQTFSKYSDSSSNSPRFTFHGNISSVFHETSFLSEISNTGTEVESLVEAESTSPSDKKVRKSKTSRGIRRRMSGILNNWRKMQVLSCTTPNPRKKYKKYNDDE